MTGRRIARFLGVAILTTSAMLSAPIPSASAQPCPDVEAIFARGTVEPPGVGGIGQAFVGSGDEGRRSRGSTRAYDGVRPRRRQPQIGVVRQFQGARSSPLREVSMGQGLQTPSDPPKEPLSMPAPGPLTEDFGVTHA